MPIPNRLIVDELIHGLIAVPFAFILWKKTRSYKSLIVLFFATYLIDLDHLVDYFSFYGFKFSLREFLGGDYFGITKRAFVPFHAWEWVILIGVVAKKRGWKSLFTILVLALLPHLIFDSIVQNDFLIYSIIYRSINNFSFFK